MQKRLDHKAVSFVPYVVFSLLAAYYVYYGDYTAISQIFGDAGKIFKIGEVYVAGWESFNFSPFGKVEIHFDYWLLTAFYYLSTSILGVALLTPLFKKKNSSVMAWLGSGFVIGYLPIVVLNRIITIAFPHSIAPLLIFLFVPVLSLFFFYYMGTWDQLQRFRAKFLKAGIGVIGCYLGFLIFQLQFGRNYMVSDSNMFFLRYLNSALAHLDFSHFPIVDQQYDEVIFNYPLIYFKGAYDKFLLPFWITGGFGKASTAFVLYMLIESISRRRSQVFSSFLFLAGIGFLFFGTNAFHPLAYMSWVGGQNPLIYNGHIGRMIGVFIPWLVVLIYETFLSHKDDVGIRHRIEVLTIFIGLGIAGTYINNLFFSLFTLLLYIYFRVFFDFHYLRKQKSWLLLMMGCIVGMILCPLLTYMIFFSRITYDSGIFLLVAIALGGVIFLSPLFYRAFSKDQWIGLLSQLKLPGIYLASSGFALLFLGNIPTMKILNLIKPAEGFMRLLPSVYSQPILRRGMVDLNSNRQFFAFQNCGTPSFHCKSSLFYGVFFGLFTFICFYLAILLIRSLKASGQLNDRSLANLKTHFFWLVLCLALYPLGLYVTDFMSLGTLPWVMSRFIEVPFYSLFLLLTWAISEYTTGIHLKIQTALLAIWAFAPFIWNLGIHQWFHNLNYLVNQVR